PSGPTGASTPATPNAQRRLHPGSSTTTISAATPHSEATPPPTGCHQRDGRVHLAAELLSIAVPYPAETGAEFFELRDLHGPDPAGPSQEAIDELFAKYGRPVE